MSLEREIMLTARGGNWSDDDRPMLILPKNVWLLLGGISVQRGLPIAESAVVLPSDGVRLADILDDVLAELTKQRPFPSDPLLAEKLSKHRIDIVDLIDVLRTRSGLTISEHVRRNFDRPRPTKRVVRPVSRPVNPDHAKFVVRHGR